MMARRCFETYNRSDFNAVTNKTYDENTAMQAELLVKTLDFSFHPSIRSLPLSGDRADDGEAFRYPTLIKRCHGSFPPVSLCTIHRCFGACCSVFIGIFACFLVKIYKRLSGHSLRPIISPVGTASCDETRDRFGVMYAPLDAVDGF
ncbi:MAG: hypothetical protein ACLR56_15120 [Oscillospiraceae bacterium]